LAALENWHISAVDVRHLDEEICMEQPEGFKANNQEHR
jgi:hypothetical protein